MTDNEIIKALEGCSCWESYKSCEDCPENTYDCGCANKLEKHSLDLINRQKAEIEKIKKKLQYYLNINEENGVVYIPKFVVDNLVKEMTEENENGRM